MIPLPSKRVTIMKPHSPKRPGRRSKNVRTQAAPSREAALDVLEAVETGGFAEPELDRELQGRCLSPEDRALATELTYGVVRWKKRLDAIIDQCLARPNKKLRPTLRGILRLALYQVILLDRVPCHAAVHQAVVQARGRLGNNAAGFVNAVLRQALRNPDTVDPIVSDDPNSLATHYSYPVWLVKRWINEFGLDVTRHILAHGNFRAPMIVRANPLKTSRNDLIDLLSSERVTAIATMPDPDALWIRSARTSPMDLPGFGEGLFAVQDRASQMVAPLLRPSPGERILDACSAPGGKAAHLAALTRNNATITALDDNRHRLEEETRNLERLGVTCAELIKGDAGDSSFCRELGLFDKILLDAPCSNLGVIRHNPEVKYRSTPGGLKKLAQHQLEMLMTVSVSLRSHGTIVYSVCTVTREETTDVITRFLKQKPEFSVDHIVPEEVPLPDVIRPSGFMTTFPSSDEVPMDGFFAARLRKS
jgi:16S rRNA (cytosine967-C5)-methyltransferase